MTDVSDPKPGVDYAPAQTRESQASISPERALQMLEDGNARFTEGTPVPRDLMDQARATAEAQYPFAVVLGCIDSRVPILRVFDQGIGDIFVARVAGNVLNPDILGSLEFACRIAGAKVVVVMGHTACGAIKGAIDDAELGHLTGLLEKLAPSVEETPGERDASDAAYVDRVAERNVVRVLEQIRRESSVLAEMEEAGDVLLAGAMYDVATGEARFI